MAIKVSENYLNGIHRGGAREEKELRTKTVSLMRKLLKIRLRLVYKNVKHTVVNFFLSTKEILYVPGEPSPLDGKKLFLCRKMFYTQTLAEMCRSLFTPSSPV